MTEGKSIFTNRRGLLFISLFLIGFSFIKLQEMNFIVSEALLFCARVIIPSLFPFMIFSEMLLFSKAFDRLPNWVKSPFEKTLKIRQKSIGAFLTGIICGFPLGVKYACELFENGDIDEEECNRLLCFCNNTGPGFVIAGVGIGIRKSLFEGVMLYIIQIFTAFIYGLALAKGKTLKSDKKVFNTFCEKEFSITESVKKCSLNMLYICALIVFFSIICGYVELLLPYTIPNAIIASFLEIGNASLMCAKIADRRLSFILTAGAISFSGMSVHLQSELFYKDIKITKSKYYKAKLLQGSIAIILSTFVSVLTYSLFIDKII